MRSGSAVRGRPGFVRRAAVVVLGAVLTGGVLAGCGGGGSTGTAATSSVDASLGTVTTAADGVQMVTLQTQDDYRFTPDHFTVAPGKVRLTVRNVGREMNHNFRFTPGRGPQAIAAEILMLPPGQSKTIEFTAQTPGSYGFECSFHVDLGQVGVMTVSG